MNNRRIEVPRILAALTSGEESSSLERILGGDKWDIHFESSFHEAEKALHAGSFGVVICAARFAGGSPVVMLRKGLRRHASFS